MIPGPSLPDNIRCLYNLTHLDTGYVKHTLWLHPSDVDIFNKAELLRRHRLQWLPVMQIDFLEQGV